MVSSNLLVAVAVLLTMFGGAPLTDAPIEQNHLYSDLGSETESTSPGAKIIVFESQSGEYETGEIIRGTIIVENVGETRHTFFIGFSLRGPDGEFYDNNDLTGKPVTLSPGQTHEVEVSWQVQESAPSGDYDAFASIWEESNRDDLKTRLDSVRQQDTFRIEQLSEAQQIWNKIPKIAALVGIVSAVGGFLIFIYASERPRSLYDNLIRKD